MKQAPPPGTAGSSTRSPPRSRARPRERANPRPTTVRQIAKLHPEDGAADDNFGRSVAISGTTAIVGASLVDVGGAEIGSAYLFDAAASGMCPWDLDDNGIVGASDLLSLLATWGPCPPKADCPPDFDRDSSVGESDLAALLVNWGPCP
ncbi:MAG: FG-GAP repeat protein [Phycisphaerales bacterium]